VRRPALVLAIKDAMLSDSEGVQHSQEDGSPKWHASATLMVLERSITPDMDSYENLRALMNSLNPVESEEEVAPKPPSGEIENDPAAA
jgi:hypothetical protein